MKEMTLVPEMVLGPARKGLKVTYCTDTRPTQGIVKNAMNADLFICEGMYGEPDKKAKARENKHMTFYEGGGTCKESAGGKILADTLQSFAKSSRGVFAGS